MPENLLILDRDGVINEDSDAYIKSAAEWRPIEGSIAAIVALKKAGWKVVVASNQSGLGRGLFEQRDLDAMHAKFAALLAEQGVEHDGIFYCPHRPDECCDCRKPAAGLIRQIEQALSISAKKCFFVGDSLRDLQAARAGGCRPVLVKTGKGQKTLETISGTDNHPFENIPVFQNLAAFTRFLLEQKS